MTGLRTRAVLGGTLAGLRQLHYFVTIAEEGQMTRAADRLGVAQPALSQAVARLESGLGVKLFTRHSRGVALTSAGEALLGKARLALAAADDADATAQAAAPPTDKLEWGFVGALPMMEAPELYERFVADHPHATVSCRSLPFPYGSTAAWLEDVDVAMCHSPTPHASVRIQALHSEPRVVLLSDRHALAGRRELALEDVLDEVFCGTNPLLEPVRAGLWTLDDHRGEPAPRTTSDRATNPREIVAVVLAGRAITAAPASSARNVLRGLPGIHAIPLRDASPVVLALVWRKDNRNPLVDSLAAIARVLSEQAAPTAHAGRPPRR